MKGHIGDLKILQSNIHFSHPTKIKKQEMVNEAKDLMKF
jgi:hypothetical protein